MNCVKSEPERYRKELDTDLVKKEGKTMEGQRIKLVIWDLDETFWDGILSEGDISIPDANRKLIEDLSVRGIINSICSKNDQDTVLKRLSHEKLDGFFVFNSINWEAKGQRIKNIIKNANLRAENVIFIDDNTLNLAECQYYNPNIMIASPFEGIQLLQNLVKTMPPSDPEYSRLKQYKNLEKRAKDSRQFLTNEAFLLASNIKVRIAGDCMENINRIHDLVQRTNQLNFTKVRSTEAELKALFEDQNVDCGYVSASDNYGDYGIIGFFAVQGNKLVHFTFSCRTLGMGIEQYVYYILGSPELTIVGDVSSNLSCKDSLKWINQSVRSEESKKFSISELGDGKVLLKGPCDLYQLFPYIKPADRLKTEFTYVNEKGIAIESTGHTTNILEALKLTKEQKQLLVDEVPFADKGLYSKEILNPENRMVVLSILSDCNLGVYERIHSGERVAFLEYIHPITDQNNWDSYIDGKYPTSNFKFTRQFLEGFSEKYRFIGRNSPEKILDNLKQIRDIIPVTTTLVVMLGGELHYEANDLDAYKDRYLVHKSVNSLIRKWAEKKDNVRILNVNNYLTDQSSFYDHYNHYVKPVYYSLSKELVALANECLKSEIKLSSPMKMTQVRLKEMLAPFYHKIVEAFKNE